MKKIIHLSDIHIGHDDCGAKFQIIVNHIVDKMQPASDYIILITGDIVENAKHTEYIDESLGAIAQLEIHGYKVLVVPGNHDYGNGALGNRKYVSRFKKRYYENPKITYPKLDIIDEMAFLGLDSTAEELHWFDRFLSEGELGSRQMNRLMKMLSEPEVASRKKIVYLHHHPFDFKFAMQLKDNDKLQKAIENRLDLLLFGHYHNNSGSAGKIYNGTWGIPRCYNAGSSTHKNGNIGVHRIIDLSQDPSMDYDAKFI
jgi:3',5'-cyclic AMP phosphodiesterase CpdA